MNILLHAHSPFLRNLMRINPGLHFCEAFWQISKVMKACSIVHGVKISYQSQGIHEASMGFGSHDRSM